MSKGSDIRHEYNIDSCGPCVHQRAVLASLAVIGDSMFPEYRLSVEMEACAGKSAVGSDAAGEAVVYGRKPSVRNDPRRESLRRRRTEAV